MFFKVYDLVHFSQNEKFMMTTISTTVIVWSLDTCSIIVSIPMTFQPSELSESKV